MATGIAPETLLSRAQSARAQALALRERIRQSGTGLRLLAAAPPSREPPADEDSRTMLACRELWDEIEALHAETNFMPRRTPGGGHQYGALLRARVEQTEAELAALRATPLTGPPPDVDALRGTAELQAEQQVEQLDEGLRAMARERDELVNEIEEAREIGQEHREIHMVLQQRAEEAQRDADAPGDTPGRSNTDAVRGRTSKLNRENRQLMMEMSAFMTKYFPQPSADEVANEAKRSKTLADFFPDSQPLSLNAFLEDLMNESIARPSNPYIRLTDQHWEPYVELLLRTGIAMLHPKDPKRMKLTEFHA